MDQTDPSSSTNGFQNGEKQLNIALLAAVSAVVALAASIFLIVSLQGDSEDDSASGCLAELASRMPGDAFVVEAANLVVARQNGYDDSSVEAMMESSLEGVTGPDPLTAQSIRRDFDLDTPMPYRPSDVDCWVWSGSHFVMSGDFDPDEFAKADEGVADRVVLSDDNEIAASDDALLVDADDAVNALLVEAVEAIGADAIHARLILGRVGGEDGGAWIATSLSQDGDGHAVTTAWVFDDPAVAEEAEPLLRQLLQGDDSGYPQLVAGDPSTDLTRDGRVARVRSRLDGEPSDWYVLLNQLDPILTFDPRA